MKKLTLTLGALTFFTLGAAPQKPKEPPVPSDWNIRLYGQSRYKGESKLYRKSVPDLGAAWSSRIKSVAIGRGYWELCDKPNYKGNCRLMRSSVADLPVWGFPGPVRSIRAYVIVPATPVGPMKPALKKR